MLPSCLMQNVGQLVGRAANRSAGIPTIVIQSRGSYPYKWYNECNFYLMVKLFLLTDSKCVLGHEDGMVVMRVLRRER